VTDFARLPFVLDEKALDQAIRRFFIERPGMSSSQAVGAVSELIMRIGYAKVRPDVHEEMSKVLVGCWDDEDIPLCDEIASGLVNFPHLIGRSLLDEKARSGNPELEAIARDTLREFPPVWRPGVRRLRSKAGFSRLSPAPGAQ